MRPDEIIIKPIITEKSNSAIQEGRYTFQVAKRATKIDAILDGEDNGGDLIGFKGILARWLGKLIRDLNINTYNEWTTNNAHSAWVNRNSDNIMWTKFGTKTEDNIENSTDDNKMLSIENMSHISEENNNTFVNNYEMITFTGVVLNIMPYVLLLLVGVVLFVLTRKKYANK